MGALEVSYEEDGATFVARPTYGKPVVFEVARRRAPVGKPSWGRQSVEIRYVVQLRGSSGAGFSTHISYDAACKSALSRARRYEKAYSVPRGLAVVRS